MDLSPARFTADCAQVLQRVLERARAIGNRAVVVFDLDSTLFDNRPRQARILREFGASAGVAALIGCAPSHWESGFNMRGAMRNCGLSPEEVERLFPQARKFWLERFFTSEYCSEDVGIPGAAEFVKAVAETGAVVCYVTGRHIGMKEGTLRAMARCGLPLPGGDVRLILKPSMEMGDDEFKREAQRQLAQIGQVIAAFDNEPTHVNDYRRAFPDATIVHLATDHSGRPVPLLDGVETVPHFGDALSRSGCSTE